MAPVTARRGGAMEGKEARRELRAVLNGAGVACPQSRYIWRPPAAGANCFLPPQLIPPCLLSHSQMGGVGGIGGRAVFSQALCPYFCNFLYGLGGGGARKAVAMAA
ncbi:hypothetical protein CRENBAI_006896, partial [Crenichthys baileyi]